MIEKYQGYYIEKGYTSVGLFVEIKGKFNPKKVIYGGCYVHITPSLIFDHVVYVDSFKNTFKFFEDIEVKNYIKKYNKDATFKFYQQDYTKDIPENLESLDLIISQYGGFVGQALKKYLKVGGLLVCNNSHGDASMASFDPDYELVAVYNKKSDEKFTISEKNLNEYLVPKNNKNISKEYVEKNMKGVVYSKSPSGYIFRKVKKRNI